MKKIILIFQLLLIFIVKIQAQNPAIEAPATNGIYVVVSVLAIIFTGLAIYLFTLDRKMTRLEKEFKDS
jgi:CcmD family protein